MYRSGLTSVVWILCRGSVVCCLLVIVVASWCGKIRHGALVSFLFLNILIFLFRAVWQRGNVQRIKGVRF
jgi:hypothetical protein